MAGTINELQQMLIKASSAVLSFKIEEMALDYKEDTMADNNINVKGLEANLATKMCMDGCLEQLALTITIATILKDRLKKNLDITEEVMINQVKGLGQPTDKDIIHFKTPERTYGLVTTHSVVARIEEVPDEFIRTKEIKSLDKIKIKKAIDSGVEVPGAQLSSNIGLRIWDKTELINPATSRFKPNSDD